MLKQPVPRSSVPPTLRPTAALMRLVPRSGSNVEHDLSVRNTIGIAERIHESLVQKAALHRRCDCPELTGHDRDGRPLNRGHQHAHILPVDLNRDGSLDHLLIWVPMGMGPRCEHAIDQLSTLVTPGGDSVIGMFRLNQNDYPVLSSFPHVIVDPDLIGPPDHAMLLADALCDPHPPHSDAGSIDQPRMPGESVPATPGRHSPSDQANHASHNPGDLTNTGSIATGEYGFTEAPHSPLIPHSHFQVEGACRSRPDGSGTPAGARPSGKLRNNRRAKIIEPSTTWISLTPFVPARFIKPRGKNSLTGQLQRELQSRGMPPAEEIEQVIELAEIMQGYHLARRFGKPQPPQQIAFAVRIRFSEPVYGPIALGYASHFGLGVFQAVSDVFTTR